MAEVFVSYRAADARYPAAYLADRLGKDFGPDRVFRDADALVPGLPWPDGLDRALADARVLVVLIGPGWLDAPGPDGSGRALDRPDDWVRREIRTALTREIPVIPVLLDDTTRPAASDLPAELASLAGLQTLRIRHDRLEADVEWLASVLADGRTGYVVHSDAGRISVIDLEARAIVRTIDGVGSGALAVAITPDQRTAYITHISSPQVSVVDLATGIKLADIDVGAPQWDVEVHPDGRRAFVANRGSGRLTVIDTASNAVVTTISTADDPRDSPVGVVVTPDGSRAYATNRGAGTVAVVDTQRNSLISRIAVERGPNGAAVAPDGSHLYVTNEGSGTLSIVNLIDGSVVAIPVGSAPITVAVTPDGHRALVVARGSTSLVVLDTTTKEVLHTVDLGHDPGSISVAPDGRTAYVTAGKANLVLTVTL